MHSAENSSTKCISIHSLTRVRVIRVASGDARSPPEDKSDVESIISDWFARHGRDTPSGIFQVDTSNPAVTVGLYAGGRIPASSLLPYILAQLAGAVAASAVLYLIASGKAGFDVSAGFAANGYGEHSPGGYSLQAGLIAEVVLTFMFLLVIMGATDTRAPAALAPLAIGLALTLIHLVGIPVTNTSVNPARSTGPALFVGGWAMAQLWLFWLGSVVGGALGGYAYRMLLQEQLKKAATPAALPAG
jgi:aquaporin Z